MARTGVPTRSARRSKKTLRGRWLPATAGVVLLASAVGFVIAVARTQRQPEPYCTSGLVAIEGRCCGKGQTVVGNMCKGKPNQCPETFSRHELGCVFEQKSVSLGPGEVLLGPKDWESEKEEPHLILVGRYALDRGEVTEAGYEGCGAAGLCPRRSLGEPGKSLAQVTPAEAEVYCRFRGGRLPTSEEWIFAAASASAHRFPWGPTGLVCRRAVFGMSEGPCGNGAIGPELAGARNAGATPSGIFDLSGNVAEWARMSDGTYQAHGGSYRSKVAGELKSWSRAVRSGAQADVGFRCAYDL